MIRANNFDKWPLEVGRMVYYYKHYPNYWIGVIYKQVEATHWMMRTMPPDESEAIYIKVDIENLRTTELLVQKRTPEEIEAAKSW